MRGKQRMRGGIYKNSKKQDTNSKTLIVSCILKFVQAAVVEW